MKKVKIFILIILILSIIFAICFSIPTLREKIIYFFATRKTFVKVNEIDKIQISYYPSSSAYKKDSKALHIEITDKETIDFITNEVSNKVYQDYSANLGLIIFDAYVVNIGNNVCLKFPDESSNYMYLVKNNHSIMTKSIPKVMKKIVDIVDEELTKKAEIFRTDKVTITNMENGDFYDITDKETLENVFDACKKMTPVEVNEIEYPRTMAYKIDFNNGIEIFKYKENKVIYSEIDGYYIKDGKIYELYNMGAFDSILK